MGESLIPFIFLPPTGTTPPTVTSGAHPAADTHDDDWVDEGYLIGCNEKKESAMIYLHTASEVSVMRRGLFDKLDLAIEEASDTLIPYRNTGSSNTIKTLGIARNVSWGFTKKDPVYQTDFYVVNSDQVDVIIGKRELIMYGLVSRRGVDVVSGRHSFVNHVESDDPRPIGAPILLPPRPKPKKHWWRLTRKAGDSLQETEQQHTSLAAHRKEVEKKDERIVAVLHEERRPARDHIRQRIAVPAKHQLSPRPTHLEAMAKSKTTNIYYFRDSGLGIQYLSAFIADNLDNNILTPQCHQRLFNMHPVREGPETTVRLTNDKVLMVRDSISLRISDDTLRISESEDFYIPVDEDVDLDIPSSVDVILGRHSFINSTDPRIRKGIIWVTEPQG
ncbi:hypothetical protein BO78DRAFT_441838 [Aspergillus sclerotiicarbonarius CBS 121057]|uniref:Uncharacterized protein n=1 Tax=Aspergillus sclerotiicarbonarius (strain CBS 121057 / IBT 28362) TaxID=1448318 RepID=A0A319EFQ3_ASPSB|nr:hypothetical protein BO78DRAFT_441838 [Aspergillus sclerotiicarbonarius CBS 121057]